MKPDQLIAITFLSNRNVDENSKCWIFQPSTPFNNLSPGNFKQTHEKSSVGAVRDEGGDVTYSLQCGLSSRTMRRLVINEALLVLKRQTPQCLTQQEVRWLMTHNQHACRIDIGLLEKVVELHYAAPAPFAALSTARTLAVAMSSSMPTPQMVLPFGPTHST